MQGAHVDAYQRRLTQYETVLLGRATYVFGYAFGLQPGKRAYPHMDHHVFSSSLELPEDADVLVHKGKWSAQVERLRNAPGGDIYLCGGGKLAGFLANNGLIDLLRLKTAPIVLGRGTPLFAGLQKPLGLRRVSGQTYENGVTYGEYAVCV